MPNQYQIVIAAVDRATAVVGKVNASFRQLTRPIGQVQSAVGRFGREMGLDRVARDMASVGRAAVDVGRNVSSIVAPLAAVAGAGSIAAVAGLAVQWANLGAEINRTSIGIGVTTDKLQSLRGAGRLVGVSNEAVTGGLKSLGDTMQDALYGRNQQALVMMSRLGLRMKTTSTGAVDTSAAFSDLAGAISKIKNPQVQNLVARTFGLEEALPLLRQGKDGLAELERQVRATGALMTPAQITAAARFDRSLSFLSLAAEGLRNSIGDRLIPIIQPLVDRFSGWVAVNRDLIATKVGEFVSGIAAAVEKIDWDGVVAGVKSFAGGVESLVGMLGGWENAAIAVVVVMNGSLIASVVNLGGALVRLGVDIVPVVIRAFGLLGAALAPALSAGALKLGVFTEGLATVARGVPLVGTALSAASSGFVSFGAAIEATPIGWIITGAAAVAGAVYLIYRNWGSIVSFFEERWAGVKAAFQQHWTAGVVRALIEFNPAVLVARGINALVEYLTGVDLFEVGARLMEKLLNGVRSILPSLPKSVANAVRGIGRTVQHASSATASFLGYGAGAPIGLRQNNPGNLRSWGDTAVKNGFAEFATPAAGISAMVGNLQAYQKHGWNTLESIAGHWAPAKDKNDVPAYIAKLASQTGFKADAALDLSDPKVLSSLVPALIKNENGKNPYDSGVIAQAISSRLGQPVAVADKTGPAVPTPYQASPDSVPAAQVQPSPAPAGPAAGGVIGTVVIELQNAPPGTRVQSQSTGPIRVETRVGYAMQQGAL